MLEKLRGSTSLGGFGQDPPTIRVVSGRKLARELKRASPNERALVSADAQVGRLIVTSLPPSWANKWFHANQRLAKAARELLPLERAAVRRGQMPLTPRRCKRRLTESQANDLLDEIGEPRVWAWIERRTTPVSVAAE
jgi:hypothetical protein